MKRYGFKYEKFSHLAPKINLNVGTWIGLIGTFLFMAEAAESGGFKGQINGSILFTIIYPALLWLLNYIAVEHIWAKKTLVVLSGIFLVITLLAISYLIFVFQTITFSIILFLALNIAVFYYSRKIVFSIS